MIHRRGVLVARIKTNILFIVLLTLNVSSILATVNTIDAPKNLIVLPATELDSSVVLLWDKPNQVLKVAGYEVFQNGQLILSTEPNVTYCQPSKLTPGTTYQFYIIAKFKDGTFSEASNTITAKTKKWARVIEINGEDDKYKADASGQEYATEAIQKAIDEVGDDGLVKIPKGIYKIAPITITKSNRAVYLAEGAKLQGSAVVADYLPMEYSRSMGLYKEVYKPLVRVGNELPSNWRNLIDVPIVENVVFFGSGEIAGGGDSLRLNGQLRDIASKTFVMQRTKNVAIIGLNIGYGPSWCVHPLFSDRHTTFNTNINSAMLMTSGDGWDPESSTHCYLVGGTVQTHDNVFCAKAGRDAEGVEMGIPTKHMRVIGVKVYKGFSVAMGSECAGGIEDVIIRDCLLSTGFELRTNDHRGGYYKDIIVEDCDFAGSYIYFMTDYIRRINDPEAPELTRIGPLTFRRLVGVNEFSLNGSYLLPDKKYPNGPDRDHYIKDILFEDILTTPEGKVKLMSYCDGITFKNVRSPNGVFITPPTAENYTSCFNISFLEK